MSNMKNTTLSEKIVAFMWLDNIPLIDIEGVEENREVEEDGEIEEDEAYVKFFIQIEKRIVKSLSWMKIILNPIANIAIKVTDYILEVWDWVGSKL